jgi:hypothetical protein
MLYIHVYLFIGGVSGIPKVLQTIQAFFNNLPDDTLSKNIIYLKGKIDCGEIHCFGAGVHAKILSEQVLYIKYKHKLFNKCINFDCVYVSMYLKALIDQIPLVSPAIKSVSKPVYLMSQPIDLNNENNLEYINENALLLFNSKTLLPCGAIINSKISNQVNNSFIIYEKNEDNSYIKIAHMNIPQQNSNDILEYDINIHFNIDTLGKFIIHVYSIDISNNSKKDEKGVEICSLEINP